MQGAPLPHSNQRTLQGFFIFYFAIVMFIHLTCSSTIRQHISGIKVGQIYFCLLQASPLPHVSTVVTNNCLQNCVLVVIHTYSGV